MPLFRQTLRNLTRTPGFTVAVVLVLALGMGANTAIFSVAHSLLIKPLPFQDPERVIQLWEKMPGSARVNASKLEYQFLAKELTAVEGLAAHTGTSFTLSGKGEPEAYFGQIVTAGIFRMLGAKPSLGRTFRDDEGQSGHDRVVVLSHTLWASRFASDRRVVGSAVTLNGERYEVIGVMPEGFAYPASQYQLWVPTGLDSGIFKRFEHAHFLRVIGRLKPGVTAQQVQTQLETLYPRLLTLTGGRSDATAVWIQPIREVLLGETEKPLLVLSAAVGLILLIACINVANLLLARAAARQREIAIRAALGASRIRIILQLLTEAAMLSLAGGLLGMLAAVWSIDSITKLGAKSLPRLELAQVEWPVFLFAAALVLCTTLLFGLAPAITASRAGLSEVLKQSSKGIAGGGGAGLRSALVFAEIALSFVILAAAGLMMKSLYLLEKQSPGFHADSAVSLGIVAAETAYPNAPEVIRLVRDFRQKLMTIPGAEAAGASSHLPFSGNDWGEGIEIEGREKVKDEVLTGQAALITPGYIRALGLPLKEGRDVTDADEVSTQRVALVNEAFVRKFLPGASSAVGRRIRIAPEWTTIVGVVGDARTSLNAAPEPSFYLLHSQVGGELIKFLGRGMTFVVRSAMDTASVVAAARSELKTLDAGMPLRDVQPMRGLIEDSIAEPRFRTSMIGFFALLALALATAGIYGVLAYVVEGQTREIGVRIALGASGRDIATMVLTRTGVLVGAGIATGAAIAIFVMRALSSLLFGVQPADAAIFSLVAALLAVVAAIAAWAPARRALRVDPLVALRYD